MSQTFFHRILYKLIFISALWYSPLFSYSQAHQMLTLDTIFQMAERNSKQLSLSKDKIDVGKKNVSIANDAKLPDINADATIGYLSNAQVWNKHFSYERTVFLPHISNEYSVAAGLTIYNGGAINNSIAKAKLQEQLAELDYKKNKEEIEFLLLAKYLDLFTLYNQKKIYEQNITLANKQLGNIEKLAAQGMVTHNDIIRAQLQLSDFKLKVTEINNDINITSYDLCTVIGYQDTTIIEIDTTMYNHSYQENILYNYINNGTTTAPEILLADKELQIRQKEIDITKTDRLPKISLYASYAMARPFLYTLEPVDIYMQYFQGGVKLQYNISALYKSKKTTERAKLEYQTAQTQKDWATQNNNMKIHSAYIKLEDAKEKYQTSEESYRLAQDNYRVIIKKYDNKLAVMTEVLDASTALLSSQLNLSNANVSIIYNWYNLQKQSGYWENSIENTTLKNK